MYAVFLSVSLDVRQCIFGGALATEASFQIENNQVAPSEGTVVNGTLVVFEHGSKSQHYQYWMNDSCVLSAGFRPPVISGVTTVNEGDTLELNCDASNSRPLPPVKWFSPDGNLISNNSQLTIVNITRTLAGNYTCIATNVLSGDTMRISAYITILRKCAEAE